MSFVLENTAENQRFVFEDKPKDRFVFEDKPKIKPKMEQPSFIAKHPTLYGLYGASLAIAELGKFGHVKYADPYEIKQLMKLSPEEQKRQLLMDTAEDMFLIGGERIAGKVGLAAEYYFPRLHKWLSTPRHLWKPAFLNSVKKAEKTGASVMELIGVRRAEIDKGILDSEIFIRQFEGKFSKTELEAIPFIRQGIKNPEILNKIGKQDLIPIIEKPSPELLKATAKIGKYYDEAYQFLKDNWGDVGFVEDYVTHIWDIPKARKAEVVNYFATRNPFLKKRTIPTLEEGIELGLTPKTTNITELLRIYDQYKIKTVHNFRFAQGLKDLTDETGQKIMMRIDKAPEDWITIDHPALNRAMAIGKVGEKGILLNKVPVKVHPEIAKEIKIIFDKPFSHAAISAFETVNAFTKKSMLTLTFFHHFALTEAAFATGIGRKAVKLWNPFRIYRALKHGDFEIFKQAPLAKDSLDSGVTYGALSDIQRGRVQNALIGLEKVSRKIPIIRTGTKALRKANDLWDTGLWDYYHNTLKLWAYESNLESALKLGEKRVLKEFGRNLKPEEIANIKKTIGTFVNDTFGGQNWELNKVLGNPKVRQMLHWAILAPDWTFSVLKQAAAPAKGIYLMTKGEKLAGRALAKRAASFWAKAGIYFNLIAQSINQYTTKKEYGEGRFTWENAPGHELNIFIGRNKDGTERYLRMGKQFREVLEWGYEPEKKIGGKLSPIARESIRQLAKHDPGSGYPTEFEEKAFFESVPERLKSIAEMPIPFSLRPYVKSRPGSFMFTFPTSKGMTNYKTVKLFKEALAANSLKAVRRIYISALENNLDAQELFKSARAAVKADITYNNRKLANEILLELNRLDPEAQKDALLLYKRKGILTPEIYKQLIILKEKQLEIKKQRKIFEIER